MNDSYPSIKISNDYLDIFLDFIKLDKDINYYDEILKKLNKYYIYQVFNIYETLLKHYINKLKNKDYYNNDDKQLYHIKLLKVIELKKLNIFDEFTDIHKLYNKIYHLEHYSELSNIVNKIVHKFVLDFQIE